MIATLLSGAFTGLIGTALSSVMTYFSDKQKYAHEVEMLKQQTAARISLKKAQVTGEIRKAELVVFDTSQTVGNRSVFDKSYMKLLSQGGWFARNVVLPVITWAFGMIEVFKGFIRPGLTVYLTALTSWVTYTAINVLLASQGVLTHEQAYAIVASAIDLVFYLTTTAVTWWFGERVKEKHGAKLK